MTDQTRSVTRNWKMATDKTKGEQYQLRDFIKLFNQATQPEDNRIKQQCVSEFQNKLISQLINY